MESSPETLDVAQWWVAALLLGLSAVAMPLSLAKLPQALGRNRQALLTVAAAVALGALVRWIIAPHGIATVFIGYRATREALALFPVPHYGMGTPAFYHLLLSLGPADHATIWWANSVLGVLTLPLVAAFTARLFRDARVGAVTALLVALVPLFVRNDNSDANNVPLLFWLFGGLVLWQSWLADRDARAGLLAVPMLALAAVSRPEMVGFVPLLGALVTWVAPPTDRRPSWRTPMVVFAAIVYTLMVVPQTLHVLAWWQTLEERGSLPGWDLAKVLVPSFERDALPNPQLFPLALLALAVLGALRPREGRRAVVVAIAAVVAYRTATLGDLDFSNVARVQVPMALFVTMLGARGLVWLGASARPRLAVTLAAVAIAVSAAPTAAVLFAPTNEQQEEDFLREALAALPPVPLVLVRPGDRDRRTYFTHMYFPDYLLGPGQQAQAIAQFTTSRDDRPAYFLRNMRCYADFRPWDAPPPEGSNELPACALMDEQYHLTPVIERTVENRGDRWLGYYGTAETLRLGLYRVEGPSVPELPLDAPGADRRAAQP